MPWPKTGKSQYHAQLAHPDEGRAIKGLVVCNYSDREPLVLLIGLALGCYKPSPEVSIVLVGHFHYDRYNHIFNCRLDFSIAFNI